MRRLFNWPLPYVCSSMISGQPVSLTGLVKRSQRTQHATSCTVTKAVALEAKAGACWEWLRERPGGNRAGLGSGGVPRPGGTLVAVRFD
jgi:hypothetical protein